MIFHRHKYNLIGNRTLWCECGKSKTLPCEHIWVKETEYNTKGQAGNVYKITLNLRCTKCGENRFQDIKDNQ